MPRPTMPRPPKQADPNKEAFLNGWVCGVYSTKTDYRNDQDIDVYDELNIDHPSFAPPIGEARSYETTLPQSEVRSHFRKGWICGAARGVVPIQDIAAKTGLSREDIQQIVTQEWDMIWRCGFNQFSIPDKTRFKPEFDRSCSYHSKETILAVVKLFLEGLYERPFVDLTDGEDETIMRDIRCAMANGLDFGMLFAIARIKWVKKQCRQCKGRWALGNTTWAVPCISRRCESTSDTYKCSCHEDAGFCTTSTEAGIYQPTVEDGTIRDATSVPPRRLWDIVTNRVVPFFGRVSALCQWCYDTVSFSPYFLIVL